MGCIHADGGSPNYTCKACEQDEHRAACRCDCHVALDSTGLGRFADGWRVPNKCWCGAEVAAVDYTDDNPMARFEGKHRIYDNDDEMKSFGPLVAKRAITKQDLQHLLTLLRREAYVALEDRIDSYIVRIS